MPHSRKGLASQAGLPPARLTFRSFSGRYLHCRAISTYLSKSSGAILGRTSRRGSYSGGGSGGGRSRKPEASLRHVRPMRGVCVAPSKPDRLLFRAPTRPAHSKAEVLGRRSPGEQEGRACDTCWDLKPAVCRGECWNLWFY